MGTELDRAAQAWEFLTDQVAAGGRIVVETKDGQRRYVDVHPDGDGPPLTFRRPPAPPAHLGATA